MSEGKVVKAKPLSPHKKKRNETLRMLAMFCRFYPQYTLAEARKLSYRQVLMMIDVAQKMEASKMMTLLNIVVAPHTKKGMGVKKVESSLKRILNN